MNDSESVHKRDRGNHSIIRIAISLVLVGSCVLLSGCNGGDTIWSAGARSPDGLWLASARTIAHGGFGTDNIVTIVYLKRTHDSNSPMEVLLFSQNAHSQTSTIDLKMDWINPSHLEVTYKEHPSLEFQVIKCAGIEISVRDLSSEKT